MHLIDPSFYNLSVEIYLQRVEAYLNWSYVNACGLRLTHWGHRDTGRERALVLWYDLLCCRVQKNQNYSSIVAEAASRSSDRSHSLRNFLTGLSHYGKENLQSLFKKCHDILRFGRLPAGLNVSDSSPIDSARSNFIKKSFLSEYNQYSFFLESIAGEIRALKRSHLQLDEISLKLLSNIFEADLFFSDAFKLFSQLVKIKYPDIRVEPLSEKFSEAWILKDAQKIKLKEFSKLLEDLTILRPGEPRLKKLNALLLILKSEKLSNKIKKMIQDALKLNKISLNAVQKLNFDFYESRDNQWSSRKYSNLILTLISYQNMKEDFSNREHRKSTSYSSSCGSEFSDDDMPRKSQIGLLAEKNLTKSSRSHSTTISKRVFFSSAIVIAEEMRILEESIRSDLIPFLEQLKAFFFHSQDNTKVLDYWIEFATDLLSDSPIKNKPNEKSIQKLNRLIENYESSCFSQYCSSESAAQRSIPPPHTNFFDAALKF